MAVVLPGLLASRAVTGRAVLPMLLLGKSPVVPPSAAAMLGSRAAVLRAVLPGPLPALLLLDNLPVLLLLPSAPALRAALLPAPP